jgi:tetratricopeptide (TPR) repeat protein
MQTKCLVAVLTFLVALAGCAQPRTQVQAPAEGLPSLEQHAKADPANGDLQFRLGQEYMRHGKYNEAAEAFKKSYGGHSPVAETWSWHWAAFAYEKAGKHEAAVSALKRSIELNPNHADNYVFLARLHFNKGQYDDAITAAKQAASLQPTLWTAPHFLGASYGKKKQYTDAIASLRRASELAPKEPGNFTWMGDVYIDQDMFPEAISAYTKASELAPENAIAFAGIATSYYFMGRYDDALPFNTRGIELTSFTGLGLTISEGGTFPTVAGTIDNGPAAKAEIKAGDTIVAIDGQSTRDWGTQKFVEAARGAAGTQANLTIERAGAQLDKKLVREKVYSPESALYFANRSTTYLEKGDLTKALEDAKTSAAISPKYTGGQYAMASIYLRQGDFAKALEITQAAVAARWQVLKATALAKLGRTSEALETFAPVDRSEFSARRVPVAQELKTFFDAMKPYVAENRTRAAALEVKGAHREALAGYSEALKVADPADAQAILSACFTLVRKNPALGQVSEEARRYAIRSETLVKQGSFADGLVEIRKAINEAPYVAQFYYNAALINAEMKNYREAIRNMQVYLAAAPDSPHARAAKDEIIKWELAIEKGK